MKINVATTANFRGFILIRLGYYDDSHLVCMSLICVHSLLYTCQVTRTFPRGEKSNRDVFGRSKVETTAASEHLTTETLRQTDRANSSSK